MPLCRSYTTEHALIVAWGPFAVCLPLSARFALHLAFLEQLDPSPPRSKEHAAISVRTRLGARTLHDSSIHGTRGVSNRFNERRFVLSLVDEALRSIGRRRFQGQRAHPQLGSAGLRDLPCDQPQTMALAEQASPSLEQLTAALQQFAEDRDWGQYHTPRNLLLALVGEVGMSMASRFRHCIPLNYMPTQARCT